ncbi:hypothetical protein ACQPZJ_22170 [Actinoplanes sp. CA-054009]
MRLFRKKASPEADTIAEFWQWWAGTRDSVATAIGDGSVARFADDIGRRVEAIHPGLQWELAPGSTSAHALVVTSGGQPESRAVAARWLAAAPAADETWSYRAARAADPAAFGSVIDLDGLKLDLSEIRYGVAVDEQRRQIDVVCYHPGFAGVPDEARGQITFLTLDWAVGENDVEIWLGEISWTAEEPAAARTPAELRQAVDVLSAGEDRWVLMQGTRSGAPLMATAAVPLRSARWPRFDLHLSVSLPYRESNDGRLPVDGSLAALRDFEDALGAAVAGNGVLVAHETWDRQRVLHFYVDSRSSARAEVESRLPGWREGRASVDARPDPAFERVGHLSQ